MIKIETERLILEPLGIKHLDDFKTYALDYDTGKFMMFFPKKDMNEVREELISCDKMWNCEKPTEWVFAIMNGEKNVGFVGVYDENGKGELGWMLSKDCQGKGFGFEAASAAVKYGLSLGYTEFVAHCDSENYPSYHLMEKLGMTRISEKNGRKNYSSDEDRIEYTYYMDKR